MQAYFTGQTDGNEWESSPADRGGWQVGLVEGSPEELLAPVRAMLAFMFQPQDEDEFMVQGHIDTLATLIMVAADRGGIASMSYSEEADSGQASWGYTFMVNPAL